MFINIFHIANSNFFLGLKEWNQESCPFFDELPLMRVAVGTLPQLVLVKTCRVPKFYYDVLPSYCDRYSLVFSVHLTDIIQMLPSYEI